MKIEWTKTGDIFTTGKSITEELRDALTEALEAAKLAGIHQHPDSGAMLLPWYQRGLAAVAKATTK